MYQSGISLNTSRSIYLIENWADVLNEDEINQRAQAGARKKLNSSTIFDCDRVRRIPFENISEHWEWAADFQESKHFMYIF